MKMDLQRKQEVYGLLLIILLCLCGSIEASYTFYVGGRDGWVIHPTEDYAQWSSRNRFQVNDILYFKYKKEDDSVLEVSKQDFDTCNTDHPLTKLDDGNSRYTIQRSGPHYFISGNKQHCQDGQKLVVVVLSQKRSQQPPPGSSSSSPSMSPLPAPTGPATSPPPGAAGGHAHGPSTATSPSSSTGGNAPSYAPGQGPSSSASGHAPSYAPGQGPSSSSGGHARSYAPGQGPSSSAGGLPPSSAPAHGHGSSSSPQISPATSPSSSITPSGSQSPSPAASSSSPAGSPSAETPGAGSVPGSENSPSPAPGPEGGDAAADKSPSAGSEVSVTTFAVLIPTIVAATFLIV